MAQENKDAPAKPFRNTLTLVAGTGYNYYFNDIENIADNGKVYNNRYAFSLKLYWEPMFRVKIGLESGFYSLYKATGTYYDTKGDSQAAVARLNVIPVFITISTRVYNQLYLNVGTGLACMVYNIDGFGNKVNSAQFSFQNLAVSLSYYFPVNNNLKLGAEVGYMKFGKTEDDQLSAQFSAMYNLFRW